MRLRFARRLQVGQRRRKLDEPGLGDRQCLLAVRHRPFGPLGLVAVLIDGRQGGEVRLGRSRPPPQLGQALARGLVLGRRLGRAGDAAAHHLLRRRQCRRSPFVGLAEAAQGVAPRLALARQQRSLALGGADRLGQLGGHALGPLQILRRLVALAHQGREVGRVAPGGLAQAGQALAQAGRPRLEGCGGLAQPRQPARRVGPRLAAGRGRAFLPLVLGTEGGHPLVGVGRPARCLGMAGQEQVGLGGAQLGRELAVALRLPALLGELGQPRLLGGEQIEHPLQVGARRLQPQLGLAPARLQARRCRPRPRAACGGRPGLESTMKPIWPWLMIAGLRAPAPASANSICTSRARASRPLMR